MENIYVVVSYYEGDSDTVQPAVIGYSSEKEEAIRLAKQYAKQISDENHDVPWFGPDGEGSANEDPGEDYCVGVFLCRHASMMLE
jgi:hypothetical protein